MPAGLRKWLQGLLVAAAMIALTIFIAAPLVGVLGASLSPAPYWQFPPEAITLRAYAKFLSTPSLVSSTQVSLAAGLGVGLLGTLISFFLTLAIGRRRVGARKRNRMSLAVLIPLLVPAIALGLGIFYLYAVFKIPINLATLVLAQASLVLPLITNLLLVGLRRVQPNVERAALNLGARPSSLVWRVILPLMRPVLITAAVLGFIRSFDDTSVALFVNSPSTTTLPVRLLSQMQEITGPLIAAGGSVLLIIALGLALVLDRTIGLSRALGLRDLEIRRGGR
jgi:putative spermidine/putrescine transport system permease protein